MKKSESGDTLLELAVKTLTTLEKLLPHDTEEQRWATHQLLACYRASGMTDGGLREHVKRSVLTVVDELFDTK